MVDTNNIIRVFLGYLNNLSVEMSAIYFLGILLLIYNYIYFRVTRQMKEAISENTKLKKIIDIRLEIIKEKEKDKKESKGTLERMWRSIGELDKENKELKEQVHLAPKWDSVHEALLNRDEEIVSVTKEVKALKALNTSFSNTIRTLNEKCEEDYYAIKSMRLTEKILIDNGLELVKTMSEDELTYNEIIDIALFDTEVK